ncbi:MAG: ferrous iron transport protein A [Ignavibacterium sp.]|jgi:ferrous iron transport protein A
MSPIPLHKAKRGSILRIEGIPEGKNRALLLRLGILKGEVVRCLERLPGGTIVLEKNRQEIAVGFSLASTILVAVVRDSID